MSWPFVGRTEQLDSIRRTLAEPHPAPVILLGTPGMGRSRLLTEALATTPLSPNDTVLRVKPAGPAPFAALARLLPPDFTTAGCRDGGVAAAAEAVTGRLDGRRPLILADDAHHVDHLTVQVLRRLGRVLGAPVFVTAADTGSLPQGPDPLDCLRYEPGSRTVRLPPLSSDEVARVLAEVLGRPVRAATTAALHAATGGNPGLLHDLVVRDQLAGRLTTHAGMYQLAAKPPGNGPADRYGVALGETAGKYVTAAIEDAWRELALDRATELCRLASWYSLAGSIATTWAAVLLLRGHVAEGLRILDAHAPTAAATGSPRVPMTRAMLVGIGLRRIAEAEALLVDAARTDVGHRERLLACRAWLLAVTGSVNRAAVALEAVDPDEDREATVFYRAAHAAVALATGRAHQAVSYFRRALAAGEWLRTELPWFPPYLTACLIDSLLLAGRISEATAEAAEFHASQRGSGWNVAVAFDSLLGTRRSIPAQQVLESS